MNPYQQQVWNEKADMLANYVPPNKDATGDQAPLSAAPLVINQIITPYPNPGAGAVVINSYQVPTGQRARIVTHALQHAGGNPPEISNSGVLWRFLVNGAPLKGLGAVTSQIGAFATPVQTVIWLTENDLFQVTVELPAASPGQSGSSGYFASGWTAPLLGTSGGSTQ